MLNCTIPVKIASTGLRRHAGHITTLIIKNPENMNTKWNWTIFHHSPAAAWSLIAICSVLAACNGGGDGRTKCTSVIGVECNDTLASTISDVFTDTECTCAGTACPTGTTCDDGDPTTTTDVYVLVNDTCSCHGTEPAAPPKIPIAG